MWKASTKREGITCSLCLWWIKQGIRGLNCSGEIEIRCWEKFLIEIMKNCTRFLGEVRKFHRWRGFTVLDIDYEQRQRQQWSTHLLEMPLIFCYCELQEIGFAVKGVAKKWDSCLDLRCARFLCEPSQTDSSVSEATWTKESTSKDYCFCLPGFQRNSVCCHSYQDIEDPFSEQELGHHLKSDL